MVERAKHEAHYHWFHVKASVFCNVSARSRHFVNVDVIFSLLCVTASAFQHTHLAKDVEVFVTNCMNNPRSCSAGVDEMRVFQLFVSFVPTMFSGILGFFGRYSTVLSPFWSACKHS